MSNEENRTDIAAEETVDTDSSKHILKHLENSEIRQQEKLDKVAETFKPGLTGLTETFVDLFKQRNETPGSSNEEPPATALVTGILWQIFCAGSSAKRSFKPVLIRGYKFPLREVVMDVSSCETFSFL